MKKVLSLLLCLGLGLSLFGCGSNDKTTYEKLTSKPFEKIEDKKFMYNPKDSEVQFTIKYEKNCSIFLIGEKSTYTFHPNTNIIDFFVLKDENKRIIKNLVGEYYLDDYTFVTKDSFRYNEDDRKGEDEVNLRMLETNDFIDDALNSYESAKKSLEKNGLSFKDINIPFDELNK